MRIEVSREDVLLDTGGGLKKASWFFLEDSRRSASSSGDSSQLDVPFLLHNVDVISNIDLHRMVQFHMKNHALATLAVQARETNRYLLFNEHLQLCGRRIGLGPSPGQKSDQKPEIVRTSPHLQPLAFSGIHVISPRLLPMLTEEGVFSIITSYLRLAAQGEKILAFRADDYYWRDIGTPENVMQAAQDLK